jgi:hypothetical protein
MKTMTIREKLHQFIDQVEDKRAKAIYTLFESEIEQGAISYSDEFKAQLDERIAYYKKGGKMVTPDEMQQRLESIKKRIA